MCLQIEKNYQKPPNKSIRYKVLYVTSNGVLESPFREGCYWRIGSEKRKRKAGSIDSQGYHVFVNYSNAAVYTGCAFRVVKCECSTFVAGGCGQEIWKRVKPLCIVKKAGCQLARNKKKKSSRKLK